VSKKKWNGYPRKKDFFKPGDISLAFTIPLYLGKSSVRELEIPTANPAFNLRIKVSTKVKDGSMYLQFYDAANHCFARISLMGMTIAELQELSKSKWDS
jgi:hypothetical protein